MKILHLIAGDLKGGAAKGAVTLHLALKRHSVQSTILTNSKLELEKDDTISILNSFTSRALNYIRARIDRFLTLPYTNKSNNIFSTGIFGYNFTTSKFYKEADIIHLHWINSLVNIKDLSKIKKPIIWTFRDMWPMTGGCHINYSCQNYLAGCGQCKQLKSKGYDLSKYVIKRKKKYLPKNLKIVGISNWISNNARASYLFKNYDIRTINNCIDTNIFFPLNKKESQKKLNINTKKKIILTGAQNLDDPYKGFDKFVELLGELEVSKYFICFFGYVNESILANLNFEYKNLGIISKDTILNLAYNSADVFVSTSILEPFGKTIVESMSCKTPVVCFDTSGPKDLIDHRINGYKAKAYEVTDLKNGIEYIIKPDEYENICNRAIKKVKDSFDSNVISKQYIELYKEVLTNDYNR